MQNIDLATLVIIAATVVVTLIGIKDSTFFDKYKLLHVNCDNCCVNENLCK